MAAFSSNFELVPIVSTNVEIVHTLPVEDVFQIITNFHELAPKAAPEIYKSISVEGEIGVGTLQTNVYGDGVPFTSSKQKFDTVDLPNSVSYTIFEGDILGDYLESITHHLSISRSFEGESVYNHITDFKFKEACGIQDEGKLVNQNNEVIKKVFKAIEAYITGNPCSPKLTSMPSFRSHMTDLLDEHDDLSLYRADLLDENDDSSFRKLTPMHSFRSHRADLLDEHDDLSLYMADLLDKPDDSSFRKLTPMNSFNLYRADLLNENDDRRADLLLDRLDGLSLYRANLLDEHNDPSLHKLAPMPSFNLYRADLLDDSD